MCYNHWANLLVDVLKNLMLNQGNEKWKKNKAARFEETRELGLGYCWVSVNHEMEGWATQGGTWSYEGRLILAKGYKIQQQQDKKKYMVKKLREGGAE